MKAGDLVAQQGWSRKTGWQIMRIGLVLRIGWIQPWKSKQVKVWWNDGVDRATQCIENLEVISESR
tara:strand:+ start:352 stop:549 length:198 start_codon:yes stop_codon:yes gene_type:complete